MRFITLMLFLFYSNSFLAQIQKPIGAENLMIGKSTVLEQNAWAGFHNPAVMAFLEKKWNVGLGYSNFYFLNSLNQIYFATGFKIGNGRIACGFSSMGWHSYSENLINLSYGLEIFKGFSLGIGINYYFHLFKNEPKSMHGISPDFGLKYHYKRHFSFAFSVENIFALNWMNNAEKLPISIQTGFEVFFGKSFRSIVSLKKVLNAKMNLSIGFEYRIKDKIIPRLGFSLVNLGFSGGITYKIRNFNMHLAFFYASILGPISAFDLSYEN